MRPPIRDMRTSRSRPESLRALLLACAMVLLGTSSLTASSMTSRQIAKDLLQIDVVSDTPVIAAPEELPPGFHRVINSDLPLLQETGRPELPYRTILIGLPAGKTIQLTARSLLSSSLGAYRLAPFIPADIFGTEPRNADDGHGVTRAEIESAQDPLVYSEPGDYPGRLAVVQSLGVLRDQPVAEVRVYPLQYRPLDFELVHAVKIELRVRFVTATGEAARWLASAPATSRLDPMPGGGPAHLQIFDTMMRTGLINYDMVARDRASRRARSTGSEASASLTTGAESLLVARTLTGPAATVKVTVSQDGLYQVTPAMLTAAGVSVAGVDPLSFHMISGGVDVPIQVDGEGDGVFDPNDRVIFFGTGIKNDRYTKNNIYYLSFNASAGPRVTARSGAFTGAATTPASFTTTVHAEVNINYTSRIRAGVTEAWYWGVQSQGDPSIGTLTYPFTLTRIDPVAHTLAVRARYLGLTNGNHTPRLFLNNTQVAEDTFAGQVNFSQTASPGPSSSLLLNGANNFKVTLINNGSSPDQVATDYFEVDYRRTYAVDGDQLMFDGEGSGTFHWSLSNLGSSNLLLWDVTAPGAPQSLTLPAGQISTGPPFTASFEDTLVSDRAYVISTRAALKNPPAVTLDAPSALKTPTNGADYIIITDRSLLSAVQPLATFRAGQGLRTMIVATDDIYDEFNFGRVSPSAIRSFLTYAYTTWNQLPAPTYVVLAGDGHIDYTGNFGAGATDPEIVPPILRNIGGLEEPSDNDYVAVAGGDLLPEMFVGRLPIHSAADATTIINNIVGYETNPPITALNHQSLFVADNDDPIFPAILTNLQAFMPSTMAAAQAYLPGDATTASDPRTLATTDAVVAGYDNGSLLATYLGHGAVSLWATEKIFEHNPNPPTGGTARLDFNRLAASGRQSFLVTLNCINGYFVDLIPAGPGHVDFSLAEESVRRAGRGAIASWAPSALGQLSDYDSISYELYTHLFSDHMTTLGPATIAALVDSVNLFGVSTSNLSSMHLFGDPATGLALDSDGDGILDYRETALGTDPADADTDDDGLSDGVEINIRGTNPLIADTDGDGLYDGTETGVVAAGAGTDPNSRSFVPDADPNTTTNPLNADTDGGGASDGVEDANLNGRIDAGETNPNNPSDDVSCPGPLVEVTNLTVTRSGNDLVLSWDPSPATCAAYRVYAATNAPFPKSSFAPFALIGGTASTSFTHVGAAVDANQYDYLVRIVHPQLGPGPLGAYGQ
ncbi:MAG TPA: C25 family cysteine peptidase [Patescibacteria group bacterium]|nr:C25 family cysteine peptidase [Patescibacteria group bacterium]